MAPPLPFTVITGFLGAGKTTLLNRVLAGANGLRVGVLQNERGAAGIEAVPATLARVEISEGCACCVRNPDLVAAARELAGRGDLDRVLFETSGLAEPLPLTWTLSRPDLLDLVRVDAVVAVVDALHFGRSLGPEWTAQVAAADLVLVTKREVAGPVAARAAEAEVRKHNPRARVLGREELDPESVARVILDLEAPGRTPARAPAPASHSAFRTLTVAGRDRYRLDPLEDLLDALPPSVFRAKGIVLVEDGRWVRFHAVASRVQVDLDVVPPDHEESRLVFFGPGLDEDTLRGRIRACLAALPPA